jgi:hypothetical protein
MRFLRVKNWEQHQHYKERNPPWVKFYTALLDPTVEPEYSALGDDAKLLLHHVWLLAGVTDNNIPERWLNADRLNLRKFSKAALGALLAAGFVFWDGTASKDASDPASKDASKPASISPLYSVSLSSLVLQLRELGIPISKSQTPALAKWPEKYGGVDAIIAIARNLIEPITLADRPLAYLGGILRNQANGNGRPLNRTNSAPNSAFATAADFGVKTLEEHLADTAKGDVLRVPETTH